MDRVDPDLSAEEQTYVRHYLGYADALIRSAEENASSQPGEAGLERVAESEKSSQDERPTERVSILMDEPDSGEDDPPMRRLPEGSLFSLYCLTLSFDNSAF